LPRLTARLFGYWHGYHNTQEKQEKEKAQLNQSVELLVLAEQESVEIRL